MLGDLAYATNMVISIEGALPYINYDYMGNAMQSTPFIFCAFSGRKSNVGESPPAVLECLLHCVRSVINCRQ